MSGVILYKGSRNKSYFVSTNKQEAINAAKRALHLCPKDVEVKGCYIKDDEMYFDVPNGKWYAMYAAFSK